MNDELRAAAQSSLLFSFQLALPNGRADENKEEKKGLAALMEDWLMGWLFSLVD